MGGTSLEGHLIRSTVSIIPLALDSTLFILNRLTLGALLRILLPSAILLSCNELAKQPHITVSTLVNNEKDAVRCRWPAYILPVFDWMGEAAFCKTNHTHQTSTPSCPAHFRTSLKLQHSCSSLAPESGARLQL